MRKRSLGELRAMANRFRLKHNPSGTVPVPIERILEIDLDEPFDIVPVKGVLKDFGLYGSISFDKHSIYIDLEMHQAAGSDGYQYRFTLAHEFAHFVLHGELFNNAATEQIRDLKSLKKYYESIPNDEYKFAEDQATRFAALLLVPQDALLERLDKLATPMETLDRSRAEFTEQQRERILIALSFQFEVPLEYVSRRVDEDGLFR